MLALIKAESGLNPKAARYGVWPDVSFGYSQYIVLYHYFGDHTPTQQNIDTVRDYVFSHPDRDLDEAAIKLSMCIDYYSLDGSVLGGMVAYNAGSDRRDDPEWMAKWGNNVVSYQWALQDAEGMI